MKSWKLIGLTLAFGLAGCGGGGDATPPISGAVQPSVLTGVLVDSAVQGIAYSTPTRSGVTDISGTFEYREGETVTFSVFGQSIGSIVGGPTLNPFNLQSPTNHPDFALNLIRLLQTTDIDADPANGITLPAVSGGISIDFDQPAALFESDPTVASLLGTRTLVPASAAVAHLHGTIAASNPGYTVNLAGRTGRSTFSIDGCVGATAGRTYSFADSAFTMTYDESASVSTGLCVLGPPEIRSVTRPYSNFLDPLIACGPTCSYADLNRTVRDQPRGNGRTYNVVVQHVPGTKVITFIWTEVASWMSSWSTREVLTLD
jgi:hypothetical protein